MSGSTRLLSALLVPAALLAQSVSIPSSGAIFDSASHSLRLINGIMGAATLGTPLPVPANITTAALCSSLQFALVGTGDQSSAKLAWLNGAGTATLPASIFTAPDQIVLSSSCSAALLFSVAANEIQVITGLPNSPVIAADFPLGVAGASGFALSDDGATILCVVPGSAVYLVGPAAASSSVFPLSGSAAVALRNNKDALIADTSGNQIVLIPDVTSSSSPQVLAGSNQGITSPNAVTYEPTQQLILAGNGGSSNIALISPADGSTNYLDCGCQISFSSLGNARYAIAAPLNGSPLLVLDASSSPAKVLFVAARQ